MYFIFISSMLSIMISMILMILTYFISMKKLFNQEKLSPFECGFNPLNSARIPFSLHFFMISILFLIFDIEIIIIIPMIITMKMINPLYWFISIMYIIVILTLGLIHEWINGILNWTI
uniref:NADH-ubiquinone oxidoreductase chain 3 n=1 Tax=Henschiella sp. PJ-2015 TaxID=1663422 RepID=A0A342D247_9HEMI|nr:NADH dehydrogenase subunit 3 [Henschiella sp. PJ-2015]